MPAGKGGITKRVDGDADPSVLARTSVTTERGTATPCPSMSEAPSATGKSSRMRTLTIAPGPATPTFHRSLAMGCRGNMVISARVAGRPIDR